MKSKSPKAQDGFSDDYCSGLQPYIEDVFLQNDIEQVLSCRHMIPRIKKLAFLHTQYASSLSHGQIDYYIRAQKKLLADKLLSLACFLLIAAYFLFALYKINDSYQSFHHLDVSNDTFQKAVEYYENGEYPAAMLRFKTLYDNEWNSASSVRYLSSIYQIQEDYDAAAGILLDYLTNRYGLANITTDNAIYAELRDLHLNCPLSAEMYADISDAFDLVSGYSSIYIQLFSAIRDRDYEEADYLCQNLKSVHADGFSFAACYSNVLVGTNRIEDAYNLIMETVRDDRTPHTRMISTRQRFSLVQYILPYLNEEQQITDCKSFIANELAALHTVLDSDSAEPYLPYEDVEFIFQNSNSIYNLKYRNPLDRILVHEETVLTDGKELYSIEFLHHDGDRRDSIFFFMDMKQNIYLALDDKCLPLPVDEPSNPPVELIGTVTENYILSENPDILLGFQYDENNSKQYEVKNISSGEIIFSGEPEDYSDYGAFAYFQKDGAHLTLFFSANDAVILVTKDPKQEFSYLEGRYQKEETP